MLADLRLALRVLRKSPAFTFSCVVTLAIGIGVNSAMFSIIHRLLWNPLDLPDMDRLVMVHQAGNRGEFDDDIAPRTWLDLQADATTIEALAVYNWWSVSITGAGDPEQVQAFLVSPDFFPLLRGRPALGRLPSAEETDGKGQPVVVLANALWRRRFGADPTIVGKPVVLDGVTHTVVGVMGDNFLFPSAAEAWAPLTMSAEDKANRTSRYLGAVGRLRPGATLESAKAEVATLGARLEKEYPQAYGGHRFRLVDLATGITEDFTRAFIYTLFGAALFVLLISCANVAGLYIARGTARRKELAVRLALGARRGRIMRQLLTETVLLGVLGGVLALVFAAWVVDAVKSAIPPTTTRYIAGWTKMGVDPVVWAFTFGVSAVTGAIFGLWPAIQLSRPGLAGALQESGRATAGRHTQIARSVLVVFQAALALSLLIAAGAMVKGFRRMAGGERQLVAEGLLTMQVNLPEARYAKPADVAEFYRRVVERLGSLPRAEGVAAINNIPWGNQGWSRSVATEANTETRADRIPVFDFRPSTPAYLGLIKLPFRSGRAFTDADTADAPPVAIVSEAAARQLWPGEDAVGKRFQWGGHDDKRPWVTVVGVVADLKRTRDLWLRPTVYIPLAQGPSSGGYLVVRAPGDPMALARAAREAVASVDPQLPVTAVRTLEAAQAERLSGLRIGSQMMAGFALCALLLAAIGLYGVVAYLVTQRTHEIGIRLALGAQRSNVLALVLRRGLLLTAIGVVLGLLGAFALVRTIRSAGPMADMVIGDASVFVGFTAAMVAIALLGSYLPARRATRVDPMIALRSE